MSDFIPPRDANFQRWQAIVARVVNRISGATAPSIADGSVGILPVVVGTGPPQLVDDGAGHLFWVEIFE